MERYEELELEIIAFDVEDVILTSESANQEDKNPDPVNGDPI